MMKKLLCTLIITIFAFGFSQAQSIDVTGLGVVIPGDGSNVPVVTDDTDFGSVDVASGFVTHTFTVNNITASAIILTGLNSIGGTNPTDFSRTDIVNPLLNAGESSTFTITFDPNAPAGLKSAIISIDVFNFSSGNETYIFNVQGTATEATAPDINVFGNGISIVSPDFTPSTLDDTDFGQVDVTSGSVTHTFTIANTGNAPLNLTGAPLVSILGGSGNFTVTNLPTTPIPALTSTTFDITFDPSSSGLISANVLIQNNDPDEANFLFTVRGEGTVTISQPDIDVIGNGVSIISPDFTPSTVDDTDFGQVDIAFGPVTHTFTIANTGNAPLNLTGAPLVSILGGSGNFTVTNLPTTPIAALSSTTFDITYDPSATGIVTANVLIQNNDPDSAEANFVFTVRGEGIAEPEINVLGNGISIIGDGTNTPNVADGTDFGSVQTGTSSTEQIFTIENTGSGDLIVNPSSLSDANFVISTAAISPVAAGGSTTIGITFNAPVTLGVYNATLFIANDDSDEDPYQINITAESISTDAEMDVFGNGVEIADGDITPDVTDGTDFGSADVTSGSVSGTFTIENNGGSDLNLTDPDPFVIITGDVADFSVNARPPSPITPGGSSDFVIEFNPTALGIRTATVSIGNNDSDENPYTFVIQGEGIDVNADSPLLITQYYEGAGNDQWIEVKNISLNPIASGFYNLVMYTNTRTQLNIISTEAPLPQYVAPISGTGPLGQILAGEVVLFKNPNAALPGPGNLGPAALTATATQVCTFTGNDVILISTSTGVNCYNDRIDIMGVVPPAGGSPPNWGANKTFIKGCGTTEQPSLIFDVTPSFDVIDYIELLLEEVNNADPATNIALGTQNIGSTTWTTSWDNGTTDRTRVAIINGTYNDSDGSFGACDLTISGDVDFNGGTSNYIEVSNSLVISFTGSLTIGDQESLYTVNATNPFTDPVSIIGIITTFHTTTQMTDNNDYTYWSSPVENVNMSSVFAPPSYNQGRLYYWDQSAPNVDLLGGSEALGEWIPAAGVTMTQGKGYISQGPVDGTYPGTATVNFTGRPNSGSIDLIGGNDVVFNNNGNTADDLNLIGNPYPSAIDADLFIENGDNATSINGTLWFWSHRTPNNLSTTGEQYSNDDYASYNLTGGTSSASGSPAPTQYIGSGQGFMVQASSTDERISFTDEMRVKGLNTQFFRGVETKNSLAQEKDRVWLNLESSEGGAFSQILVGFMEKATDGFDRAYDGIRIGGGWVNFYSKMDTLKYGIQGLSSFNLDKKVPLAFNTYINDAAVSYKISIDHIEGVLNDNDLYLVDHKLNIIHDLKQGSYNFSVDATGSYDDRFTLQFTKSTLGIDELALDNNFVVINEENSLRLRSNTVITKIKVYDITGRLLVDEKPNNNEFSINTHKIGQGTVLILNATFENGAEISKKAIKY